MTISVPGLPDLLALTFGANSVNSTKLPSAASSFDTWLRQGTLPDLPVGRGPAANEMFRDIPIPAPRGPQAIPLGAPLAAPIGSPPAALQWGQGMARPGGPPGAPSSAPATAPAPGAQPGGPQGQDGGISPFLSAVLASPEGAMAYTQLLQSLQGPGPQVGGGGGPASGPTPALGGRTAGP